MVLQCINGVGSNKTIYQCFQPLPVPMAARITKSLNKYVRRGILPPQVLWNDLRGIVIKQRHWQTFWGIINVDQVGYNKTIYLCFHPLPVPMVARITKYLNKYVRRGICLIYMSSFYFWRLYSRQFWPTRPWFFTSDFLHRSYGMIYGE
jgi:hypothetical protein